MALKFWISSDGKIVRGSDGKILLCETCPCPGATPLFDCCDETYPGPSQIMLTVAGIANQDCSDCTAQNGTYILDWYANLNAIEGRGPPLPGYYYRGGSSSCIQFDDFRMYFWFDCNDNGGTADVNDAVFDFVWEYDHPTFGWIENTSTNNVGILFPTNCSGGLDSAPQHFCNEACWDQDVYITNLLSMAPICDSSGISILVEGIF